MKDSNASDGQQGKDEALQQQAKPTQTRKVYVVGIGASAGGLEALQLLFDSAPSTEDMAFVIIQHLSPDYKSLMTELLMKHTTMRVEEAVHGVEVQANHIYMIPSKKNMTIRGGKLILTDQPKERSLNFPIDIFFHSLAEDCGSQAVGVVLSGTGSDGTRGVRAIKEHGGMVVVQQPESAKFDGMPRSAIHSGLADYILHPREMLHELSMYLSHPDHVHTTLEQRIMNQPEEVERILRIIRAYSGVDFSYYKRPTLIRRIAKRMTILNREKLATYIDLLYDSAEEKKLLASDFLIGVTRFFRDPEAFKFLQDKVVAQVCGQKAVTDIVKIWVIGCSTGEEVYSLAMLFDEFIQDEKLGVQLKIFATDIDKAAIEIASKGIYDEAAVAEISPGRLKRYFLKKNGNYQIHPELRKMIVFSQHDILKNPPFNKVDLVSCRNVMIYFQPVMQQKMLSAIHYALNLNGYLMLGPSESIMAFDKVFEETSQKWKVYKNIEPSKGLAYDNLQLSGGVRRIDTRGDIANHTHFINIENRIAGDLNESLLEHLNGVSVYLAENFDIIHAFGKLREFCNFPEKGFSNNLLKLLPDELSVAIATVVRKLNSGEADQLTRNLTYAVDGENRRVRIMAKRLRIDQRFNKNNILLTLLNLDEDVPVAGIELGSLEDYPEEKKQILELEESLKETRASLQSTIEELESSNEEMQVTNEELIASNEELQSTNEELQSLNEELYTVNSELQQKNSELEELYSDMNNLFKSSNIATIFLDEQFCIRKFTPTIRSQFQLQENDIGRPISDFSSNIYNQNIIEDARSVLQTLQPFSKEIQADDGRWFMKHILPYRDVNETIRGVVISFFDITYQKQIESEIKVALQKERELNELKSRFVSMASHEFRTPLSTINSSASLIEKYEAMNQQEKRLKHVGRIKKSVSYLVGILNDFLSLSKIEEGKIQLKTERLTIPAYCKAIVDELSDMKKKRQKIEYKHEGDHHFITDANLLRNILFNLLSNAIKYSEEQGIISFTTTLTHGDLFISVTDDGIGIPLEDQAKIFDRFYRANNVANIQGTGLGLSIVKRYLELLMGDISFQSEVGKGTTFELHLTSFPEEQVEDHLV